MPFGELCHAIFSKKEVGHCEQQYALSKCIFVDLTKLSAYSAQM